MSENNALYEKISAELNLGKLLTTDPIQTLWSGYGEIVRLIFVDSNKKINTIIVKHVKLPKPSFHPRGWNTNLSHQRKLQSYQVEVNWYQEYSKNIDEKCRFPKGLKTFQNKNEWLIVMEDLSSLGYTTTPCYAYKSHLNSSINWLANFHAKYMNSRSNLLWEIGTYWHLDTRPDELELLEDIELKTYAKSIDEVLKNTKYQTIVHGDAKLANFCFNHDGTSCAAVDFQYVGHGCGMKDLAYFMSSAIEAEVSDKMEAWVLETYFKALKEALEFYHPTLNFEEIKKEWKPLFSLAWADFQRFIKGWSPNHFKINSYTEDLTKKALEYLKTKHC